MSTGTEGLTRRETEVMRAVYTLSAGKERFLVTLYELLNVLPKRGKYDEERLERALAALALDGYFELIPTERKGEKTYVVHMREGGLAFRRSDIRRRRGLRFRLFVTVICGVLSALIGVVLRNIFS